MWRSQALSSDSRAAVPGKPAAPTQPMARSCGANPCRNQAAGGALKGSSPTPAAWLCAWQQQRRELPGTAGVPPHMEPGPWPVLPLSLISAWCDALRPSMCPAHLSSPAGSQGCSAFPGSNRALDAVLHTMAWAIIQGDALCNDSQALSVLM